jgi:serine/threonine protein kinase
MHRKGVYHLDMRKRDNVLVAPDGKVHLLDFGSAVLLRPDGLARRWLGPLLAIFDRYAVLKWKSWLHPSALTPSDRRLLRRLDRLRGRAAPTR